MFRFSGKQVAAEASVPISAFAFIVAILVGLSSAHAGWIKDGIPICSSLGDQWYACITSDGAGGAFIAWYEVRLDSLDSDIYVQRIDRDGNILWEPDGVPISITVGSQSDPEIVQDGLGGVIIAWRDARSGTYHVYVQRVDGSGNVMWTPNGIPVCSVVYPQYMPLVVPDGRGNYFVSWRDDRHGYGQIYCQKLDGGGNPLWPAEAVQVCPTLGWEDHHRMISDTAGGVILVWVDERYGFLSHYIYAQRLDENGNLIWTTSGAPICLFDYLKTFLECIPDGAGGGIVTWHDNGSGPENVYAQRFTHSGTILWTARGEPVCEASGDQIGPHLTSDAAGGAIIAWLDGRDGRDDIYAQRIGANGASMWQTDGIMLRKGPDASGLDWAIPDIVRDENGGAIITWQEGPGDPGLWDIFAQRIDGAGSLLWPDTAVAICQAPGGQYYPQIGLNGDSGAIITWRDMRQDTIGAVYAMRVTANGETVATLLQSWAASIEHGQIRLEWSLSEIDAGAEFIVLRSEASGGTYEELTSVEVERQRLLFSCVDNTCEAGLSYRYRVDVEVDGSRKTLFETEVVTLPRMELALLQNYPNPFNPSTMIEYRLPEKAQVRLEIYDTAGRRVACVVDGGQKAGSHSVKWDGKDASGRAVSSGVYFYRLTAGRKTMSRKMVLLK
jgi:hypothetical protein